MPRTPTSSARNYPESDSERGQEQTLVLSPFFTPTVGGATIEGAFLNSYLDGDVVADRVAEWSHRLAPPRLNQYTVVAEQDGEIIGFAHVVFDHDPRWGALLDNLHVTSGLKRLGIGTTLLSEAAQVLVEQRPSDALYLWVLEQNKAAQAFYASRGGTCVGSDLRGPFPGGGRAARRSAAPTSGRGHPLGHGPG